MSPLRGFLELREILIHQGANGFESAKSIHDTRGNR